MARLLRRFAHVFSMHVFEEGTAYQAYRFGGRALVTPLRCDCGARDEMWTRIHELRGVA